MTEQKQLEPTHFESLYPDTARQEEIGKLVNLLKQGESAQIISFPGVGRSNLTRLLTYNKYIRAKHLGDNQKWFHFVLVDFSEIRKKPLFDATKFLFLNLVDSLRERNMLAEYEKASQIFKESLSYNDELVLFQGLKKTVDLLAIEKELTIVFLFDRFEEYIPMLSENFFTNLQVLRSRAKYRFSVVFSTNKPLEEMLETTIFAPFYEFVEDNVIPLSVMDEPGILFRIGYIEKIKEKNLNEAVKKQLLELTQGHTKLTRIAVEVLLSQEEIPTDLESFMLKNKRTGAVLLEMWNSLSPSEQAYLLKPTSENEQQATYLKRVDLVKNGEITIPLFAAFVKNEARNLPETAEKIIFDSQTQDIVKGDLNLSNKLTSAEYRLLKFLIENPRKILDREEVIGAVWADGKSTAGVTDQALDQLMFRLRRKIEDDPNNPKHLETIKGRGFRFTS